MTDATPGAGYFLQGRKCHLTYDTHVPYDVLLAAVTAAVGAPKYVSVVWEVGEVDEINPMPYEHTHAAFLWEEKKRARRSDIFDLVVGEQTLHPHIDVNPSMEWMRQIFERGHRGIKTNKSCQEFFVAPIRLFPQISPPSWHLEYWDVHYSLQTWRGRHGNSIDPQQQADALAAEESWNVFEAQTAFLERQKYEKQQRGLTSGDPVVLDTWPPLSLRRQIVDLEHKRRCFVSRTIEDMGGALDFDIIKALVNLDCKYQSTLTQMCDEYSHQSKRLVHKAVIDSRGTSVVDMVHTLVTAMGWDTEQATQTWLDLIHRDPKFCGCFVDTDGRVYIARALLVDLANCIPDEWAKRVSDYVRQAEQAPIAWASTWTFGLFYPTLLWNTDRPSGSTPVVGVETFRGPGSKMCIDFDLLLQTKYDLNAKQAGALRLRHCKADDDLFTHITKSVDRTGKIRWTVGFDHVNRILRKITDKKNAEAERTREHALAQRYVQSRACEISVACATCQAVDTITVCGTRVEEKQWHAYKLDVGIVFGGSVVGAIEITNTSPVSNKKAAEMTTEGLQWAEVRAIDVIAAVRDKVSAVAAVRGGGTCKTCKHQHTSASLLCEMSELDERELQAHKRRAETDADIIRIGVRKDEVRAKIRRLVGQV